jgi:hypothetical protein
MATASLTRARCVALALWLVTAAASAQEFDVFDLNDFLDPRERGAVFGPRGYGMADDGNAYTTVRAYAGAIDDYQWRNVATENEIGFLHVAASHYWAAEQLNVKLTSMVGPAKASLPQYRAMLQYAHYVATDPPDAGVDGQQSERFAARYLVSWSIERDVLGTDELTPEERRKLGKLDTSHVKQEFGIEADVMVRFRGKPRVGSFVYVHRNVGDGETLDRFTYVLRTGDARIKTTRLSASVGFGVERSDGWHFGAIRPVFLYAIPLKLTSGMLNFSYAPSFVPGAAQQLHHELGIFIDQTVFSRLKPQKHVPRP